MTTTELPTFLASRVQQGLRAAETRVVAGPVGNGETGKLSPTEHGQDKASTAVLERSDHAAVSDTVDHLNDLMQSIRRELRFSVDEDSGHTVIRVIDADTDEVVREIPPEDVLTLVERLQSARLPGLMMNVSA